MDDRIALHLVEAIVQVLVLFPYHQYGAVNLLLGHACQRQLGVHRLEVSLRLRPERPSPAVSKPFVQPQPDPLVVDQLYLSQPTLSAKAGANRPQDSRFPTLCCCRLNGD